MNVRSPDFILAPSLIAAIIHEKHFATIMNIRCFVQLTCPFCQLFLQLDSASAVPNCIPNQPERDKKKERGRETRGCVGRLDLLNRPGSIFPLTESNYTAVRLKANSGVNSTELGKAVATL